MTKTEAAAELQKRVELITDEYNEDKVLTAYREALRIGVESVNKQEPMKPVHIHVSSGIRYGRCARCGTLVNDVWNGCPECISAIDWRDEDGN